MCKKKENKPLEGGTNAQQSNKCSAVEKAFIVISVVFSLTMAFLVIWPVAHKSIDVHDIQISLRIPNDSLAIAQVLGANDAQIGILVKELDKQSQEITEKYNVLLKSQEIETDFFRLISCIAAFVVALFGFLGYRTIKDIESKAQSLAEKTAEDYVSGHLKKEVDSQMKDIIGDTTAAKLLKEQLEKQMMPELITPLEDRVTKLEEAVKPSSPVETKPAEEGPTSAFAHAEQEAIKNLTINEGGGKDE